ncbi:MAG: hypothetical protein LBU16_05165 [Treponema sp.]|jgi:hypothetical protein|nr:hypothetical protein [Treponema sp.]
MNNKVDGKLDTLYDDFTGLAGDRQKTVVETAESLLKAQRELELLMRKTGARAPLPAGAWKKSSHETTPRRTGKFGR